MRFWLRELAVEMPRPYRLIAIARCAAGWGVSNDLSFLLWSVGRGRAHQRAR